MHHSIEKKHTEPCQQLWNRAKLNQVGEFALQVHIQLPKAPARAQRFQKKEEKNTQTNPASGIWCSLNFFPQTECHMVIYESWTVQGRIGASVMLEIYLGSYKIPTPTYHPKMYVVFKVTVMVEEFKTISNE